MLHPALGSLYSAGVLLCAQKRINALNNLTFAVCACFISLDCYVRDRVARGSERKRERERKTEKEKDKEACRCDKTQEKPCLVLAHRLRVRGCPHWRISFSQAINESLNVSSLIPVMCPGAGTLIARYDEHALVSRFKFGVLHQRAGQLTEEQLFGNRQITPAFQEFLDLLGQKIDLKDHKGYKIKELRSLLDIFRFKILYTGWF